MYEDDDDEDFDEWLGEDDWEDKIALEEIKLTLNGWYLVQLGNYTQQSLLEIDDWLQENSVFNYQRIGWTSGCAHMVGVKFEDGTDAVFFKLRWI